MDRWSLTSSLTHGNGGRPACSQRPWCLCSPRSGGEAGMAKCITCLHLYKPPPRFTNTWGAASGPQAVDLQARASEVAAKDPGPLGHGWGGERGPSRPQPGTVPFDCVFVSCPRAALGSPLRPGRPAPRGWRRLCLPTSAEPTCSPRSWQEQMTLIRRCLQVRAPQFPSPISSPPESQLRRNLGPSQLNRPHFPL